MNAVSLLPYVEWKPLVCWTFRSVTGHKLPNGEAEWRPLHRAGFTPETAVAVALHRAPMVLVEQDQLVCPVCRAEASIVEHDQAVRVNRIHLAAGGFRTEENDLHLETDRYACAMCDSTVRLPWSPH